MLVLLSIFTLGSKYLLPAKKLISTTVTPFNSYPLKDFPRANLGPVIGPFLFPNGDRISQI